MTAIARNFKVTNKGSLPIGFATLQELLAENGLDKFLTSEVLLPYLSHRFTEFYNLIAGDTPNQALNTLREIGDKLAEMGAEEGSINAMLSAIIGTKADITYVNGQLNLKADLTFVQNAITRINGIASAETQARIAEDARIEAIANGKINEARCIYLANEYYQLANVRLLDIENVALPQIKGQISTEAQTRQSEDARIEAIASGKVSRELLESRISDVLLYEGDLINVEKSERKTDVANLLTDIQREVSARQQDVTNLGIDIARKATQQDIDNTIDYWRANVLTPQYQGMVNNLRNEILAWEGVDDARMASLQALLAQLTALEAGDVTGIMNLLSQKVAKGDVLDSAWLGATLNDYVNFVTTATEAQIGEHKVVDAILLQRILQSLKYWEIDTKVAKHDVLNLATVQGMGHFINAMQVAELEGKPVDGNVLRVLINDLFAYLNGKVAKSDVLDGSIFPDTASLFATYITPDARLSADKHFNALNLRQFFADLSNYTDSMGNSKVAKSDVLNQTWSTSTLPSWIAYLQQDDASLKNKVVDGAVLKHVINSVYLDANSKINEKVAKSDIIPVSWFAQVGAGYSNPDDLLGFTNEPDGYFLDNKTFSMVVIKKLFHQVKDKIATKANSADVYTKTESDNALLLKASNARVQELEDIVAQLRADFDSLTDPQ